tara:strand:- start:1194 stop:1949 length:756 start_codon:yes stop_codon:yes gene_type:complete
MELLVYKRVGETTAELSNRIKQEQNASKVAICGKLDPMARGLTRALTNEKTKLMSTYLTNNKTYEFKLVFDIKTDTDDIMGRILSYNHSQNTCSRMEVYKSYINEICQYDEQHFHPFSAIKLTIDGKRQSLHQWTKERNMNLTNLPKKKVTVLEKEFGDLQTINFNSYKSNIDDRLSKINQSHKSTFRVDEIQNCWNEFVGISTSIDMTHLVILPIKLRVSSGFYIRMLPYYLKEIYGVNSHIYDIHRTHC